MARRGSSRRTYVRDANGRFASTPGGGGPKRPATKAVKRGPNRLTRDNAGKITSQGGDGATVRGGRLKTAAGNLRGRQVAKLKTMQGVKKPKGLKAGAITEAIGNRDRATIKSASTRIDRANKKLKQLTYAQNEIDRKRANPIGGKAFRGQATKRLNKEQRKLDKSKATLFSAVELNYKPKMEKAYARLTQIDRAKRSTSELRVSRRNVVYQGNVFGGSTASYGRKRKP